MEAINNSPAGEGLRRPAGPRLLKLLNKDQIVFIGNSIYGLELVNIPSIYKDVLIADIAAAMLGNPGCGCAGPDTPCTPDTHMFSPDIFPGLPVAQGGADIGSLLGAAQQDGLVTQPEAQFTNGLPPVSLNPVMPVADQRRSLLSSLGSASPSRALQQIQRDGLRTSLGVHVPPPPATTAPAPSPQIPAPVTQGGGLAAGGHGFVPPPVNYGPTLQPRPSSTGANTFSAGMLPPAQPVSTTNQFSNTLPSHNGTWSGHVPHQAPAGSGHYQAHLGVAAGWPPATPAGWPISSVNPSPYGNVSHLPLFHQTAAPPPPPPATDTTSTLAWMMQQMELNRAEERRMREREQAQQLANQNALLMALAGRQVHPDGHSSVPASLEELMNPTRGKFGIANRINPEADKESGATIPAQYGLFGDLSNVDISSAKNKIKSGENGGDDDAILFKEAWPNQFLNRQQLGIVKHQEMDIGKFALGFITKIYCDMPATVKGTPFHNMTKILIYLLRLSITCAWDDVLAIDRSLFQALERRQISWASWPDLEEWWKQALATLELQRLGRVSKMANPTTTAKRPASDLGGAPPAKAQKGVTFGIPNSWLKDQNLCIKFNLGRCTTSAPHPNPANESVSLRHLCAGCLRLNKGSDGGHGANKCPNKPRNGFFA